MTENLKTKQRFLEVDYIKSLMMIFIIITHLPFTDYQRREFLFNFYIDLAVPILMIISGFMYSMSISKLKNWINWYHPRVLLKRLYRFLFPFLVLVSIEYICLNIGNLNIKNFVKFLIVGGSGPGSYYTPVMVQFIFIFPILFYIFNFFKTTKNIINIQGLIVLFLLDILFNCLSTNLCLSDSLYRLSYFRYIGFTGIGIFLYNLYKNKEKLTFKLYTLKKYEKLKFRVFCLTLIFVSYLFLIGITFDLYEPVIFTKWQSTSLPTAAAATFLFFTLFMIAKLLINQFQKIKWMGVNHLVILISKSTFHIYLVQMIFYTFYTNTNITDIIHPIMNIIICIFFGVLFYLIETLFNKIIHNLNKRTTSKKSSI